MIHHGEKNGLAIALSCPHLILYDKVSQNSICGSFHGPPTNSNLWIEAQGLFWLWCVMLQLTGHRQALCTAKEQTDLGGGTHVLFVADIGNATPHNNNGRRYLRQKGLSPHGVSLWTSCEQFDQHLSYFYGAPSQVLLNGLSGISTTHLRWL